MTPEAFDDWLRRYGAAWRTGDPESAVALFTANAAYHETPFDPPMLGSEAIRRYWTEGAQDTQRDVVFRAQPIAVRQTPAGALAHAAWQASFVRVPSRNRVELDGVLAALFAADGRCREFREWWHRRETPAAT